MNILQKLYAVGSVAHHGCDELANHAVEPIVSKFKPRDTDNISDIELCMS
jgi:hypothetical protein